MLLQTEEATWILDQVLVQLSLEEWMGVKGAVMEGGRGLGSGGLKGWQM